MQMMKVSPAKNMLSSLCLFVLICCLCSAEVFGQGAAAARTEQAATEQTAAGDKGSGESTAQPADGPSTVVGRIGTYVITRQELGERLMTELHPDDEEAYDEDSKPADAQTVLMKMIAEKAMIMEARKQTFLEDEMVTASIKRYRETRLVNLLAQRYVEKNRDKIVAVEDEIKQRVQADPKFDQARAKADVERTKAGKLLDGYYMQIHTKSQLKKLDQYFPRAIEVYQRLLHQPREPRNVPWMQNTQLKDELAPSEENMVLAVFSGGQITLKNWLEAYCDIVPPRRPVISTPQAVDEMLERALRMPLLVWEATSLGLDKDPELVKQVTSYEDGRLLTEATLAKQKEAKEPTNEEVIAYFNENKEAFGTSKQLKIDLVWCEDLATARRAKADLDAGKDFEAVREQYSLEKKGQAFYTQPGSEGLFWTDLWVGEPGSILGPLKGFYGQGAKWRIVKILEKKPGQGKEYSPDMESQVKGRMMDERKKDLVAQYNNEMLKKYAFQIYADRIKDIDPLNIP